MAEHKWGPAININSKENYMGSLGSHRGDQGISDYLYSSLFKSFLHKMPASYAQFAQGVFYTEVIILQMTVTEKILARASGKATVKPGEIITASVNWAMVHDNNAPLVMREFDRLAVKKIWDPEKVVFVIDHHSPSTSLKAALHHRNMRSFVKDQQIRLSFLN